jgi:hypothetical protein
MYFLLGATLFQFPCHWVNHRSKKLGNMKKNISKIIALAFMAIAVLACERNEQPTAYEKETPEMRFVVRYAVPLSTGRADIGETEIVDAAHAAQTNVAELRPAMQQLVEAALAGNIPNYPDYEDPATSQEHNFLKASMDKFAANTDPVQTSELLTGFEMEFDGIAKNGRSTLVPKNVFITYIDKDLVFPDKLMGKVEAKDLAGIKVAVGKSSISLPEYLARLQYERYLIHFTSDKEDFGIRTFADARTVMQKVESGIVENIAPPIPQAKN